VSVIHYEYCSPGQHRRVAKGMFRAGRDHIGRAAHMRLGGSRGSRSCAADHLCWATEYFVRADEERAAARECPNARRHG
jgi:hypothetical protein